MVRFLAAFYAGLRRNVILTFFLGALLAWSVDTLFSQLLTAWGLSGLATLIFALLVSLVLFQGLRLLLGYLLPSPKILHGQAPRPCAGLILLYSNHQTCQKAIRFHQEKLKYLWLIVTPESSVKLAETPPDVPNRVTRFEQKVLNAWDLDETALAVRRALEHATDLTLSRADLICDVTGGTKTMTIGAMITCIAEALKVQMVPGQYNEDLHVQRPLEVIEIQLG